VNITAVILIPAYQPNKKLLELIEELGNDWPIIVINDGSTTVESKDVFSQIADYSKLNLVLLEHGVNRGKGAALKTGFDYVIKSFDEAQVIVTADADGQHSAQDIKQVIRDSLDNEGEMVLGVRKFGGKIPFRNWLGNSLTRLVTGITNNLWLKDTQSGLRGIPIFLVPDLLTIEYDRYEYEMSMLIMINDFKIPIYQTSIETLYIENNESSHFNPIFDSIKIYYVLFRFALVSLISASFDLILFTIFIYADLDIDVSFITARFFAAIVNFYLNRNYTFKSNKQIIRSIVEFFAWWAILSAISYSMILAFTAKIEGMSVILAKLTAEGIIYITNFFVQKDFIFIKKVMPRSIFKRTGQNMKTAGKKQ